MLLTVAVIGPAHALKGEVRLDVRTDDPEGRLTPGTVLPTDPATAGPLTISRVRFDGTRWFVTFAEAPDRTAVERLRGVRLLVDTENEADDERGDGRDPEGASASGEDDGAWYAHELIGLAALTPDGASLGEVVDLEPGVAQDRLVVRTPGGERVAVPFVEELVPEIDEDARTVTIDPPGGLFPGLGQAEDAR